jgi:hypothetical protein
VLKVVEFVEKNLMRTDKVALEDVGKNVVVLDFHHG